MEPIRPVTQGSDGFKPKWRQFHPLSRVTIQNPFDHDVIFQVANEYNQPFQYRIRAHQRAELPGGAIATLGIKAIVDELIQNTKGDEMRMWDENVRSKHEADIILLLKETKPQINPERPGEIDLTTAKDASQEIAAPVEAAPEEAFPGLNQTVTGSPVPVTVPAGVAAGLDDVIGASLPSEDAIVAPNNVHTDAEG